MKSFSSFLAYLLPIEPELKVKLTELTGEVEFRIVEGSDQV
jgi:hypothetical protein